MIAIISDIHGNYIALKAVMEELDKMNITEIYCLGDVVGYYSMVNECCDELRNRNIKCCMGNHDWYMVSGKPCERSHSVNDCLNYQKKVITKENFDWIKGFSVIIRVHDIVMLHGGWNNPIDEYLEPSQEYFEGIDGKVFCSGHTHKQGLKVYGDKIYCNPGAVGQPRDGDNRAAYALYDDGKFVLRRVSYDYEKVGQYMEQAGFESYYYGCLRDGAPHLHK